MKKSYSFYKFIHTDIKTIQKWFKAIYGINLPDRAIVEFSIYTIMMIDINNITGFYKMSMSPLKKKQIELEEEIREKLEKIKNAIGGEIDDALLITMIIHHRAETLPYRRRRSKFNVKKPEDKISLRALDSIYDIQKKSDDSKDGNNFPVD